MTACCIPRGPSGERIVDIVPGGTELELQLRRGVGKAAHTRNSPPRQVYWSLLGISNEIMLVEINCTEFNSRDLVSLTLTLIV